MKKSLIILAIIVLGFFFWGFTRLASRAGAADAEWGKVAAVYETRFNLMPDLVTSLENSMKQDAAVFDAFASARAHYKNALDTNDKAQAASEVEASYASLLATLDSYPKLKSTSAIADLVSKIENTGSAVSTERALYNEAVREYNLARLDFPGSFIAPIFGFKTKTYFQSTDSSDVIE